MSCKLENKNIYVTSSNRDTTKFPYGNSYTLYLTTPIKDITTVELLYASVPNTMYNVTDGLSAIKIGTTFANVFPGFYSGSGLATAINNTAADTSVIVSYLENEGKFLFAHTQNTPFTIELVSSELAAIMGFSVRVITATQVAGSSYDKNLSLEKYYIKSDRVAEMNPVDGVFLDIVELRTMFNECTPMGSPLASQNQNHISSASRSFGMIPLDVPNGSTKSFKKDTDYDLFVDYPYPIQKLDRLTVNWVDKNGNLVHFNGAETNSFILRFHTLRKNLCG
jgi:hypothetical protein